MLEEAPVFRAQNGGKQGGGDISQRRPAGTADGRVKAEFLQQFAVAIEQVCFRGMPGGLDLRKRG
jgi:hypothetical protein